jgi:exonuclease SbcD
MELNVNKFVYITDLHLQTEKIRTRKDDSLLTISDKLDFVVSFCKNNNVNKILIGGDIFSYPNVGYKTAGIFADIFDRAYKRNKIRCFIILGNHDYYYSQKTTINSSIFNLVKYYTWITLLDGNPKEFNDVILHGIDFKSDMLCKYIVKSNKFKILLLHQMFYGKKKDFIINEDVLAYGVNSFRTNFDLVLTGHNHLGFNEIKNKDGTIFCNPGSLLRTNRTDAKYGIGPKLILIKTGNKNIIEYIDVPCKKDIFTETNNIIEINDNFEFIDELMIEKIKMIKSEDDIVKTIKSVGLKVSNEVLNLIDNKWKEVCSEKFR